MKQLFQAGTSGNPAGRPKAQPDPMQAVRQLLPEIVERSMAQVRSGNVAALGDLVRLMTALQESSTADRRRKAAPT
jgi:hypothetical protein